MSTITATKATPTFDPHPIFSNEIDFPGCHGLSAQRQAVPPAQPGHTNPQTPSSPVLTGEVSPRSGDGGGLPKNHPHPPSSPGHPGEVSRDSVTEGASSTSSPPAPPSGQSLVASPLFQDLLDPNLTPLRICQLHGITLADLRRITESDEYKQALEDIAAINANRREAINDQLRTEALASASDLIKDATKLADDNRTITTNPRQSSTHTHTNPEAHRRALSAATRQHAANARLLETRRKAINTILKQCNAAATPNQGAMQATKSSACPSPPTSPTSASSPSVSTVVHSTEKHLRLTPPDHLPQ